MGALVAEVELAGAQSRAGKSGHERPLLHGLPAEFVPCKGSNGAVAGSFQGFPITAALRRRQGGKLRSSGEWISWNTAAESLEQTANHAPRFTHLFLSLLVALLNRVAGFLRRAFHLVRRSLE